MADIFNFFKDGDGNGECTCEGLKDSVTLRRAADSAFTGAMKTSKIAVLAKENSGECIINGVFYVGNKSSCSPLITKSFNEYNAKCPKMSSKEFACVLEIAFNNDCSQAGGGNFYPNNNVSDEIALLGANITDYEAAFCSD